MRVAVVGIGRMGSAMARAIARGEGELVLYNRTPDRARALADEVGATVVDSPAEAATADVCITMLADGAAVAAIWDGDEGLVANAGDGSVLVDMSTVPPGTLLPYADRAHARGAGILDAPVSGSTQLAETGALTIMVGGEADALERARPVFDRLAKTVYHVGPLGSGAAMKLAVNAVIFALNNAVSEAIVMAERAGIERALAHEIIANSAAGAPFVGYKRQSFVEPETAPIGFSLELATKDLELITAFADRLGVPVAQAVCNATLISDAAAHVGADRDFSQVATHLRALAGEGRAD